MDLPPAGKAGSPAKRSCPECACGWLQAEFDRVWQLLRLRCGRCAHAWAEKPSEEEKHLWT